MITCVSCGSEVTGRKFCPRCGTAVQPAEPVEAGSQFCPHCNGEVKSGAAFCMHCGTSLRSQQAPSTPRFCPACNTEVSGSTAFCTNCGNSLRTTPQPVSTPASLSCANCGRQNAPDMHFCGGCGSPLGATPNAQPTYMSSGQYAQSPYPQQPPYAQSPYPQQQYPQQYAQGGYQPQPMMGQSPMALRCPVCMAMAQVGTTACLSCHTSLAGVIPTPMNAMATQGQQGGLGSFMQGNAGKYAMGALGGAAAVLGGEMLMNGVENCGDGDMGYGGYGHHHHREEGLLGGLGELADDIGL